jgi:hypothetical protein
MIDTLLTFAAAGSNQPASRRCAPRHLGKVGTIAMSSERQESRGPLGLIASLRGRIARYREQADHFTRLAEAEPVEKIRDQWKTLARDYAYLATTLEPDGGSSRRVAL